MHYLTCALDTCVYWGKYDLWLNAVIERSHLINNMLMQHVIIVIKLHDCLPSFSSYYYFNFGVNFFGCFAPCLESFTPRPYPLPREFFNQSAIFWSLGQLSPFNYRLVLISRLLAKRALKKTGAADNLLLKSSLGTGKQILELPLHCRTEKMFPSHMSVNDLGVFAVVMVFGLLIVLLFMFDFVSMTTFLANVGCARGIFIHLIH